MKKFLVIMAFFALGLPTLTGCGGGDTVVEEVEESDGGMTPEMQAEYEKQMRSGGSSRSSQPGN